jgi:CRP/FNR family transcriptional regulator, dissimilatory nitrate respiration regulator
VRPSGVPRRPHIPAVRALSPTQIVDRALLRCPLTADLPAGDHARLRRIAVVRRLSRSHLLFGEGEPCDAMYVVVEGLVKVFKLAPDGRERVLNVFRAGEAFAEAALFGEGAYPACAQTLCPTVLVALPRVPLLALLRGDLELCFRIMASLSVKLKVLAQRLEDAAFQGVAARLAAFLLAEQHAQGRPQLRLPLAKKDLATYLAMSPETLSRLLRSLSASGALAMRGRNVRLLDLHALQEIATGRRLPAHDAA